MFVATAIRESESCRDCDKTPIPVSDRNSDEAGMPLFPQNLAGSEKKSCVVGFCNMF